MYADESYSLIKRAMCIHPNVSEYLSTLVDNLAPVE